MSPSPPKQDQHIKAEGDVCRVLSVETYTHGAWTARVVKVETGEETTITQDSKWRLV